MNQPRVTRLARLILLLVIIDALSGLSIAWAAPAQLIDRSATTTTNANGSLSVYGPVLFRPRNQMTSPMPRPREYLVLLDTSRSMSWNFAGQGVKNGQTAQCGPTSDPNVQRVHCGANAPWGTASERRIYIAKQALLGFVDRLNPNDTMRVIAFSTRAVAANDAWTSDKPALRQAVFQAGKYQGDPYRTAGEVPTASALYLARQLALQAPRTAPNGVAYGPPVVILLTSSVANSFLLSDGGWRFNDRTCLGVPFREDVATCQIGYTNDNPPIPLPITAMALEADRLKHLQPGAAIYVIGLAGVDETGLRDVASLPSYPFFSAARTGAELPGIMAEIQAQTAAGQCIPAGGAIWMNTMPPERVGAVPPPVGPLVYPTVGYIYLRDKNGNPLPNGPNRAPIVADAQTGRLMYRFNNLAPGTYLMMGFVAYKGDDGVSRIYTAIFDPNTQTLSHTSTFHLPALPPGQSFALPNLYLDLDRPVCPRIS